MFARSVEKMDAAIDAMLADHSAKGRLQSGATIKAALRIFEDESASALDAVLLEAANLIEHHGRKWSAAMAGIGDALVAHVMGAREMLSKPLRLADRQGSESIARAVDESLQGARERLERRLSDFRDGWTAPRPKFWKDRHPQLFQVILLIVGAAVALAGSYAAGLLGLA